MDQRTLDGVDGNVKKKNFKMFKIKSSSKKESIISHLFFLFFVFFLACPLLEGNFHRVNPSRT